MRAPARTSTSTGRRSEWGAACRRCHRNARSAATTLQFRRTRGSVIRMIEWANSAAAKAGPATLLFLFGAGASFGAIHVSPYPPPLGRDLYDELAEAFPHTWGAESWFAGRADDFRSDFEKTMERCIGPNAASAVPALLDMANYFAQFEPGGNDLYSRLLLELLARSLIARTVFCSLNYE